MTLPSYRRSAISGTPAFILKDVTDVCVTKWQAVPSWRKAEGFDILPSLSIVDDQDKSNKRVIPQAREMSYVNDSIVVPGTRRLDTKTETIFPNYYVKIFQIQDGAAADQGQLVLVAVSNELEISSTNRYPRSFPFLVHIHPSPQDNGVKHRQLVGPTGIPFARLYNKTPTGQIPYFYKDVGDFPFAWDFLHFQFMLNMISFPAQLKKAGKPFTLVIPEIKSYRDGIGLLSVAASFERCLLGIQNAIFENVIKDPGWVLPELEWVSISAFSIGNAILDRFVQANLNSTFWLQKVHELILFDPPPFNPSNRSAIVETLASIAAKSPAKRLLLYGEDDWYFGPLVKLLKDKGISFDLKRDRIFDGTGLPNIFFAYLTKDMFGTDDTALVTDDPHHFFPALFFKDAAKRTSLPFLPVDGQKYPDFPKP